MNKTIHLHWLWRQGPKGAEGVTRGAAICGKMELPKSEFVSFLDDATCEDCKRLATMVKEEVVASPPPSTPKQMMNKVRNVPEGALRIKMLVKSNIKKTGSAAAERFRILLNHDGKTVQEFIAAGGNPETLKNAIKDKNAEVE